MGRGNPKTVPGECVLKIAQDFDKTTQESGVIPVVDFLRVRAST
jgi:hypothetical protein